MRARPEFLRLEVTGCRPGRASVPGGPPAGRRRHAHNEPRSLSVGVSVTLARLLDIWW